MKVALKIEDNLSIEEADLAMDKYSQGKALLNFELGYILSLWFKDEIRTDKVVGKLVLPLYKLYVRQIAVFDQEEIEKAMLEAMNSESGISLIEYAAYLKVLKRRPAYVFKENSKDTVLIEMKNFASLPDNPVGRILGDSESEYTDFLVDMGWPVLDIMTLGVSKGDIFRKFSLSKGVKEEVLEKGENKDFWLYPSKFLGIRVKHSGGAEVGFCWSEDYSHSPALVFSRISYSRRRNFMQLSREARIREKVFMNLFSENAYWNSEQYCFLLENIISYAGTKEYLFRCHISRQRDKELKAALPLLSGGREFEKLLSEQLQGAGVPIYKMLAYTLLLGRTMFLARSNKLKFVFYQILDERNVEERKGHRSDSSVTSPYVNACWCPITHFEATVFVNGEQMTIADAEKVEPKSFIAAKSVLRAHFSKKDFYKGLSIISTTLLYRTIFRSFPKKDGKGFYHRFYLRKFKT